MDTETTRVKAYSYIRFSSEKQKAGDSLNRQLTLAKDYARLNNLDLDHRSYRDMGVSGYLGKNARDGQLSLFLEAIQLGEIKPGEFLLIEGLDRLSRAEPFWAMTTLSNIVAARIIVITLADKREYSIDSLRTEPMGLMFAVMVCTRAWEESATKGDRVSKARASNVEALREGRTKFWTGTVPKWLEIEGDGYRVIEERANVLRRIFTQFNQGQSVQSIAEQLNHDRVPTFKAKGREWYPATVRKLIKSIGVTGVLIPKRKGEPLDPIPGVFPVVVDSDTFTQAQRRFNTIQSGGKHGIKNTFAGLLRCGFCGRAVSRSRKTEYWIKLVCGGVKNKLGCTMPNIDYAGFESGFLNDLWRIVEAVPVNDSDLHEQLAMKRNGLELYPGWIQNVLDAILRKDSPSLRKELDRLEALEKAAKGEYAELQRKVADKSSQAVTGRLNRLVANPDNRLLRDCIEEIQIKYKGVQPCNLQIHFQHIERPVDWKLRWWFESGKGFIGGNCAPLSQSYE